MSSRTLELERENLELKAKLAKLSIGSSFKPEYPGVNYTKKLVESGQAVVFQGEYRGKKVAIKIFKEDGYRSELESLLRLGRNKNIVEIVTCFDSPKPCLVTVFYQNGDLRQFLFKNGAMEGRELRNMIKGISVGIKFLHENNLIHRDLKSGNIFLSDDLQPLIADFGLAKITHHSMTALTGVLGTCQYMAPEVMMAKEKTSNKLDIYSFGIIIWELMSGQIPFAKMTLTQLIHHVTSGGRCEINHTWDKEIVKIMVMCWDGNPDKRPSINQVLEMLLGTSSMSVKTGTKIETKSNPYSVPYKKDTKEKDDYFVSQKEKEMKKREEELVLKARMIEEQAKKLEQEKKEAKKRQREWEEEMKRREMERREMERREMERKEIERREIERREIERRERREMERREMERRAREEEMYKKSTLPYIKMQKVPMEKTHQKLFKAQNLPPPDPQYNIYHYHPY